MPSKCANHVFSWHQRGRDEAHRPAPAVGLCSHAGLTASVIALGISRLTKASEAGIQKCRLWWERESGRKESVRWSNECKTKKRKKRSVGSPKKEALYSKKKEITEPFHAVETKKVITIPGNACSMQNYRDLGVAKLVRWKLKKNTQQLRDGIK
jgi:hypothetical protein